ncbi:hypothetical protein WCLP8_3010002 [uncultured Gammaproteobacteria bacterium]
MAGGGDGSNTLTYPKSKWVQGPLGSWWVQGKALVAEGKYYILCGKFSSVVF